MLRPMRSESLGARRLAVATARPAGAPPPCASTPGSSITWFGGLRVAHERRSAGLLVPAIRGGDAVCQPLRSEGGAARPLARRRITALPALAAAVLVGRPQPARRGECDDPHQENPDQLRPARGAGRDRRGRQAL